MARGAKQQAGGIAAREIWRGALGGEDHAGLRAYLEGRFIRCADLPLGKVPQSLRYVEICPLLVDSLLTGGHVEQVRLEDGPAFLARVDDVAGQQVATQIVYLDPGGEPRERSGAYVDAMGRQAPIEPRVVLGSGVEGMVRLSPPSDDGLLFITVGVEDGLAVLAAKPKAGVWACVNTAALAKVELPAGWLDPRERRIELVVFVVPCDRSDVGRGLAIRAASRIRNRWPHLLGVGVAMPSERLAPSLFTAAGKLPEGVDRVTWSEALVHSDAMSVNVALLGEHIFREAPERVLAEADPEAAAKIEEEARAQAEFDKSILPRGDLDRARVGLDSLFAPLKVDDRRWRLAYWGAQWWVRHETAACFEAWTEKSLSGSLHHFFGPMKTGSKSGKAMAFAPTARAIDGILRCMITDVDVPGEVMPCWLPETHDQAGRPVWGAATLLSRVKKSTGPIRPQAVIAAQNGLFDSDAWCEGEIRLLPHTPRWFSRSCLPYDIPVELLEEGLADDEAADALCKKLCPTWLWFLEDVTSTLDPTEAAKSIAGLGEFCGYILTGDNSLETIMLIIAPRRGGGGTIFRAMEAIVGEDNCAHTSLNNFDGKFDMASVVGVPLMLVAEVDLDGQTRRVIINERLKSISGGDKFSIEDKYKPKVANIRPSCRIAMRANEMPRLPDPSGALASRLLVINLTQSYAGREDRTIKDRISAEGQGIMVWALFWLRRLRKAGKFTMSKAAMGKVAEFERLSAPVMAFVEDMCVQQEGSTIVCGALYACYCQWAEDNGHEALSASRFGSQLFSCCPLLVREDLAHAGVRAWCYVGVRTVEAGEDRKKPMAAHHVASWKAEAKAWRPDPSPRDLGLLP